MISQAEYMDNGARTNGILVTSSPYSMVYAELIKHDNCHTIINYAVQYSDVSTDLIFLPGFQPRYSSLIYDTFILINSDLHR